MKYKIYSITFFIILFLGIFFRFFNLSKTPPSIFSDEVDIGYQAITFNRTFTDYFGNKFPIFFQSYSDWHTPFSILPVSFFQKLIGINIYSLKLPSIIFGVLSIIFFYFLILEITKSKSLSLISLFFISLSPWHIHYSRTNFESITGMLLFLTFGIFFWNKFLISKNNKFLSLSLISFSLTPYFYSTAKLFVFFIFISIFIVWKKTIVKIHIKQLILPITFCIATLLPLIYSTLFTESNSRFSYINIFSDPTLSPRVDLERYSDILITNYNSIGVSPSFFSKLFNNKLTLISRTFLKNYFSSFSMEFLVFKGDSNLRQGFGSQGYFFYFDIFIILIGIIYSLKTNHKFSSFFIFLLIFAPIPFSLTRDSNSAHATRLILMLPSLIFFLSYGYEKIFRLSKLYFIFLLIFFIFNFSYFWFNYNFRYPQISARYWHTGIKEIILSSQLQKNNYSKIFYSSRDESMLPFFLYYTQYKSIKNYSAPVKSIDLDDLSYFTGVQADGIYYFGQIDWDNLLSLKDSCPNCLYVINENEYQSIKNKKNISIEVVDTQKTIYTDNFTYYLISLK